MSGNRCPVCQARFRGERTCSRCGADLAAIMTLAAKSWALRESARLAIAERDFDKATEFVAEAQRMYGTAEGESLLLLADYMRTTADDMTTSPDVTESAPQQPQTSETSFPIHLL